MSTGFRKTSVQQSNDAYNTTRDKEKREDEIHQTREIGVDIWAEQTRTTNSTGDNTEPNFDDNCPLHHSMKSV
jgi:hypothetical protein